MKNEEIRINKLVSLSTLVDTAKAIPQNEIIQMDSLDEFERTKGQLFFCKGDQAFYKKGSDSWMRFKYDPKPKQDKTSLPSFVKPKDDGKIFELEKKIFELKTEIDNMLQWKQQFLEWADQIKDWIQGEINALKNTDDGFKIEEVPQETEKDNKG